MQRYVLMRIENGKETMVMQCDSLESARKQGSEFKEGYSIYETKLVEYGT